MNGVGGRTIAEAKARLSWAEARRWMAYVSLRGSLHVGRRVECGSALVALQINGAHGGKARYSDFTPHETTPSGDMTPEAVLAILSRGAIHNG